MPAPTKLTLKLRKWSCWLLIRNPKNKKSPRGTHCDFSLFGTNKKTHIRTDKESPGAYTIKGVTEVFHLHIGETFQTAGDGGAVVFYPTDKLIPITVNKFNFLQTFL